MKGTNMENKTQFSPQYFAFTLLGVMVLHNLWAGVRGKRCYVTPPLNCLRARP